MKQKIAVFFGGRSPEHDISVITGIQVMNALDTQKYEIIPVYIGISGVWLSGEPLRKRENYLPHRGLKGVSKVRLDITKGGKPALMTIADGFFQKARQIPFDVALLAFHGSIGEDGCIQGLFEIANIPYTGMRLMASSVFMDKVATKYLMMGLNVPVLPFAEIRKPNEGTFVDPAVIKAAIGDLKPPFCVKPSHLGSSIGVGKATCVDDIAALLPMIFAYDNVAIVEPFVQNMVEYNVSLARVEGKVITSCIERPKRIEELLDFKEKYLAGANGTGGKKICGSKVPGQISQGMLSLTREINPDIPFAMESNIRTWASSAFENVLGTGVPRIDFIGNEVTGEIWLNEVNPCPGSYGYFLWEASKTNPILFSNLLDHLIEEAVICNRKARLPDDPVPEAARLLDR